MTAPATTFRAIVDASAAQAGITVEALAGFARHPRIQHPRQRAILLARRLRPELSSGWIGQRLGGRDHMVILRAHKIATARFEQSAEEREVVLALLKGLGHDELPAYRPLESLRVRRLDVKIRALRERLSQLEALKAEMEAWP